MRERMCEMRSEKYNSFNDIIQLHDLNICTQAS